MKKTVMKEIIIMLLLCLAILLVLGVLFYDYIPSNKIVPNKVAYTTPENISSELTEDINNGAMVNITYQLDDSQIDVSKKNKEYDPGKQNPFDTFTPATTNTVGANTTGANGSQSNGGQSNTSSNPTQNGSAGSSQNTQNPEGNAYLPTGGAK